MKRYSRNYGLEIYNLKQRMINEIWDILHDMKDDRSVNINTSFNECVLDADGSKIGSVDINGLSYYFDVVNVTIWKGEYRLTIESNGLQYSVTSIEGVCEVLGCVRTHFNIV